MGIIIAIFVKKIVIMMIITMTMTLIDVIVTKIGENITTISTGILITIGPPAHILAMILSGGGIMLIMSMTNISILNTGLLGVVIDIPILVVIFIFKSGFFNR